MILSHVVGMMTNPSSEWDKIKEEQCGLAECYLKNVVLLAAIPPICAFIGATQVGWNIGNSHYTLTVESTLPMAIGFYIASLIAVYVMGRAIHWMAQTFDVNVPIEQCVVIAANFVTPLFLAGIVALYPVPWLIMLVALVAMGYSVYLMFTGIPQVMDIDKDKGFIFASAVLTVGLVTMVGVMAATIVMWSMGFGPEYA